jgi:hypothetical protein
MNRNPVIILFLVIVLSVQGNGLLSGGAGHAAEVPIGQDKDRFCPVGQGWPGYDPEFIEPGTISGGGQTFFVLFDPSENCDCPVGFELSTIDMLMFVPDDSPFPIDIVVSMGLHEAVPDDSGQFTWLPGETVCETPERQFTVPWPKQYVGFGSAAECDCMEVGRPAFLSFTIHSELDPPGGFYTTGGGAPDTGRALAMIDNAWVDLVEAGILTRGDLVLSGFAQCCEPPVPTSTERWGTIKALYR